MSSENSGVNVNAGADSAAANSPTVQTNQQTESKSEHQGSSSAETLKADKKIPETVSYQRFKEVNEKAQAAEELLAAYKENIAALEVLAQLAEENPDFEKDFKEVVEKHSTKKNAKNNEKTKTSQETLEPEANELVAKLKEKIERLEKKDYERETMTAIQRYDEVHEMMASKDVPQELRAAFDQMAATKLRDYTQNKWDRYNHEAFIKAYEETKKMFEPVLNKLKVQHQEAPAKDIPAPINGKGPIEKPIVPKTFQERRDIVKRAFESGQVFKSLR